MSILIVGAGMVGCQAAERLVRLGEDVVLFDVAPQRDNIARIVDVDRLKLVRGDLLEPSELHEVIKNEGIRRVIHTATLFGMTRVMQTRPLSTIKVNLLALLNVLEAARLMGLERVVFASSTSIYVRPMHDDAVDRIQEDFIMSAVSGRSTNLYANTKLACEQFGLTYWDLFGVDFIALRFAGVFGPWSGPVSGLVGAAVQEMAIAALANGEIDLSALGSAHAEFDMVYSKDAALSAVLACFAKSPKQRVYNITMGEAHSLAAIADVFASAVPGSVVKSEPGKEDVTKQTVAIKACDISKAAHELGYEPQYRLSAAVADYVEWLRAERLAPAEAR